MKVMSKVCGALGLLVFLIACSQNKKERLNTIESSINDSTANQYKSVTAAVENGRHSDRKFIRTADLKCKVKSVVNATYAIENITNQLGGFVTYTNLNSSTDNKTIVPISADSSLETTYFTVVNTMTLRVPNTALDTTLKAISILIDHLDSRVIKADDVALQLLSNKLIQGRVAGHEERLENAIDNRGRKLNETADAEELLLNKQEQSDNAKISNLSLLDQVNYSTVSLSLYQRQALKRELVYNDKNIDAYTPPFGNRVMESLKTGWEIIEELIVFLARLWAFILLVIVTYFTYRKFGSKFRKIQAQ